jgi:hypothetical protein
LKRATGHPSHGFRNACLVAAACCLPLVAVGGCGGGSGVGEGATVTIYASAPLCAGAQKELSRRGAKVEGVRVRVACLKDAEGTGGTLNLATTGANARRATEDSTTVAFVEVPGREASFSRPILEEAGIALIVSSSGAKAMGTVLNALESRGDKSSREAVSEAGR